MGSSRKRHWAMRATKYIGPGSTSRSTLQWPVLPYPVIPTDCRDVRKYIKEYLLSEVLHSTNKNKCRILTPYWYRSALQNRVRDQNLKKKCCWSAQHRYSRTPRQVPSSPSVRRSLSPKKSVWGTFVRQPRCRLTSVLFCWEISAWLFFRYSISGVLYSTRSNVMVIVVYSMCAVNSTLQILLQCCYLLPNKCSASIATIIPMLLLLLLIRLQLLLP